MSTAHKIQAENDSPMTDPCTLNLVQDQEHKSRNLFLEFASSWTVILWALSQWIWENLKGMANILFAPDQLHEARVKSTSNMDQNNYNHWCN